MAQRELEGAEEEVLEQAACPQGCHMPAEEQGLWPPFSVFAFKLLQSFLWKITDPYFVPVCFQRKGAAQCMQQETWLSG